MVPIVLILWSWVWSLEKLNLLYYYWTVNVGVLIFHMNVPYDKVFLLVLNLLTLTFDLFKKKKLKLVITSKYIIDIIFFILHMIISCDKVFLLVSRYSSLWPWPSLELALIGGICVSQTHLVNKRFAKYSDKFYCHVNNLVPYTYFYMKFELYFINHSIYKIKFNIYLKIQ